MARRTIFRMNHIELEISHIEHDDEDQIFIRIGQNVYRLIEGELVKFN